MPSFFEQPILNSPYEYPSRHWELDHNRQPTNQLIESRREASFITPVPEPKKRRRGQRQLQLDAEAAAISSAEQEYQRAYVINGVRRQVDDWRKLPLPAVVLAWRCPPWFRGAARCRIFGENSIVSPLGFRAGGTVQAHPGGACEFAPQTPCLDET